MSALSSTSASAALGSLNSGRISVGGLVSGLDTNGIIEGLLALERQKITAIDQKKNALEVRQAAFKGIEARLLALQGQMTQLSRSQNSVFDARVVQSSNSDLVVATATRNAIPGVYQFRVNSLARAHQVAAQGFDSPDSEITQGSLQITVGDKSVSITVDSSNNTLQGLADSINASGAAVNASVVNDGSGDGKQGYRLLLAAKATGTANTIVISNQLSASSGDAVKPLFDAGAIGEVLLSENAAGTTPIVANSGAGYTGATNNVYTFTVVQGGVVGSDDGIQVSYADANGAHTGVLTIDQDDLDVFQNVAEGIGLTFSAGTMVEGDTFQVKAFVPNVQAAADASMVLGSGAGALTITSSTNQIDTIIPGVALQLLGSDPGKDITLTVANDTERIKTGIQDFVDAFNETMAYIDQQVRFDAAAGQAGPLLGNRQATATQDQIRSTFLSVVPGVAAQLNFLGGLGIRPDDRGQLVADDARLSSVLAGEQAGVSLEDVRKLFTLAGSSSHAGIQFVTGSTKTQASDAPYGVHITQAAEQATLAASNALSATTVLNSSNNSFIVSVDGVSAPTLVLPEGSYSRAALAQALQAAINGEPTLQGRKVAVNLVDDKLAITSATFGSASRVSMTSGDALATLGFAGGESAQGKDVVGSFSVGGVTETATGSGQFLLGGSSNANTADLQVRVVLTPAQVGAGIQADLTVSRGIASRLDRVLAGMFDPVNGRLKAIDDGFQDSIDQLEQQRTKQNEVLNARQLQLQLQFSAMERTLSQLQATSNLIAQQLASVTQK